jgi:DNA-binding IclR family transcriptional regulator
MFLNSALDPRTMPTVGDSSSGDHRIQALDMAFEIVDVLQDRGASGVSEIATVLDVPTSTAYVYLSTLEDIGYLTKQGGQYRVSLRFLEVGGRLRHQFDIFHSARQQIDELSTRTGEVANLGVEEDGRRVLLYTAEPPQGVFDNSPTGRFTRLHWTALGKALLAQLPDDRIEELVAEEGLPRATDQTITDPDDLWEEIESVRERGHSIEDEENHEGIQAFGIPISNDRDTSIPSAVSISGPKHRVADEDTARELLDELQRTANVIQLNHQHY